MENTPDNGPRQSQDDPQYPHISLETAQERIKEWLTVAEGTGVFKDPDIIPRAVLIRIDDLRTLYEDVERTKLPISGVRIYLGLKRDTTQDKHEIRGILVPVTGDFPNQVDHVEYADKSSALYDFTSPCPMYCDTLSELHVRI